MLLFLLPFKKQIAAGVVAVSVLVVIGHKTGFMQERLGIDLAPVMHDLLRWAWSEFTGKVKAVWGWLGDQLDRARIDGPEAPPTTGQSS